MAEIFEQVSIQQAKNRQDRELAAKLAKNQELAKPPPGPLGILEAATKGVPAKIGPIGEGTAAISEFERKRRDERAQAEAGQKTLDLAINADLTAAGRTANSILDSIDMADQKTGSPSATRLQELLRGDPQALKLFATETLANPMLNADPNMRSQLSEALKTLMNDQLGKVDSPLSGAIRGLGGLPPVNRITPEAAGRTLFPLDPVLRERAASGQPVFVGRGEQVARITGPGEAPTSAVPSGPEDIYGRPPVLPSGGVSPSQQRQAAGQPLVTSEPKPTGIVSGFRRMLQALGGDEGDLASGPNLAAQAPAASLPPAAPLTSGLVELNPMDDPKGFGNRGIAFSQSGFVTVRRKSDGAIGSMPKSAFNASLYDELS